MQRAYIIAIIAALVALAPAIVHADDNRAAAHQVWVGDSGGTFEVKVHPSLITSLFFPEPIRGMLASDAKSFSVRRLGSNAIVVRPVRRGAARANLVITTKTLRITVVLRVARQAGDAHPQVVFGKASVERDIQRRIDKEVARRMADARARMRRQIESTIAARIYHGVTQTRLRAIDRNDQGVILMAPRIMQIAGDTYVFFRLENRSGSTYQLASVQALAARADRTGAVIIDGKAASGPVLAQIASRQSVEGVVVVRGAGSLRRSSVTLIASEAAGRNPVRVKGVRIR